MMGIGKEHLRNLQQHLLQNGPCPRVHGNEGRIPENKQTPVQMLVKAANWLHNYAVMHAILIPGHVCTIRSHDRVRSDAPKLALPCDEKKKDIFKAYCDSLKPYEPGIGRTQFMKLWKSHLAYIVIANPRSDICGTCNEMVWRIRRAVTDEEKQAAIAAYMAHLQHCHKERECYVNNRKLAQLSAPSSVQSGKLPSSTERIHHMSFDWAQQVHVPWHPLQVGFF